MKFFLHAFLFIIISINILFADNVKWERALSIGSSSLNSSSIFDVISNTKGSKPAPAMTTTQRDAIASPQQGLMIFNTTTKELNLYNNSTWTVVANTSQSQTLTDKIIVGTANSISGLRHGTEVDSPSSGVHGVTGNLVGTTDTQNLSNKSFADAPSFLEIVTPGSPASGYIKLYAKSDERFYKLSPSGIEKSLTPVFTPSAGALFYSDGTNDLFSLTSVGTPGQYLQSNGSSVPTWVNPSSSGVVFTPSAGNVMFSNGTPNVISLTTTGTPGQFLKTNGSGTPSWANATFSGSSADLAAGLTDETGTGLVVFNNSPTFSGAIYAPTGSAGTPGISFSGDTDTGIYSTTNLVGISTNGSSKFTVDSTGRLAGSAGIKRDLSTTQDTSQVSTYYIESGTYSPSITGVTNITTVSSPGIGYWMRVGNAVTFWGEFTVTGTTGSALTQVSVTIPIASAFSTNTEGSGFMSRRSTGTNIGSMDMRNSNDDMLASWILTGSDAGASRTFGFHCSYYIVN